MDIQPFHFLIAVLAVFRLSLLLSKEDGPAWMFRKLRRSVPASSSAKKGISCIYCTSVWFAIPVSLYITAKMVCPVVPDWLILCGDTFLLMLALSAGAIIVNQQWTKTS